MSLNEQETRYYLIDPMLRDKGYNDHQWLRLETTAPVDPISPKGRRRRGPGRTDYLLCVQVGDMPNALPVAVLEAKKETDDPLKGMQQECVKKINEALICVAKAMLRDINLLPRKNLAQAFGDI